MSRTPTDIFKQLQAYEVPVPEKNWEQLRKRLFEQNEESGLQQLRNIEIPPPAALTTDILERIAVLQLRATCEALKHAEILPPATLSAAIAGMHQHNRVVIKAIYQRRMYLYIAAAVLCIVTAVVILRFMFVHQQENLTGLPPIHQQEKERVDTGVLRAVPTLSVNRTVAVSKRSPVLQKRPVYLLDIPTVFIAGQQVSVYENDLLFSFASSNSSAVHRAFRDKRKPVIVKLDDYTSIEVSEFMSRQLLDVFKTKRNGKPTHAAKRAKARINAWRKADRKAFDKSQTKSPHDIIDLTETIF